MTNFTKKAAVLFVLLAGAAFAMQAQVTFYENEFSDGDLPSGWVSNDETSQGGEWSWCDDPDQGVGDGCVVNWANYSNQHDGTFASTTADNGFVLMDSDELGGLPLDHIVTLTSTAIDCSGETEVWISFEALIGVYGLTTTDNAVLQVSTDGVDFSTTYNLYDIDTGTRWSENPEVSIVDISSIAAGESTVYLRWSWTGNYEYYWLIDDLKLWDSDPSLILIPPNEMRVNANFIARAPNFEWPLSQTEQFGFLADIENVGSTDQTNVVLNITVTDPDGGQAYTEDLAYGTVEVDTLAENVLFAGDGMTPDMMGTYTGVYTVTQDQVDDVPENNTQTFTFNMTDTLWSKTDANVWDDATRPADANWNVGAGWSWAWGIELYCVAANGEYFRTITFAVEEDEGDSGKPVFIKLYEWDDDNDDMIVDVEEREQLGIAFYTTTGTEDRTTPITLPIQTLTGEDIPLEDDTRYLAVIEYITDEAEDELLFGATDIVYGAQVLRSSELGEPRYADVLGIPADGALDVEPYSTVAFGNDVVPNIVVSIGEPLTTSNEEVLAPENMVNVFPNPAADHLTVDLDFVENMERVDLYIVDVTGKLIRNVQLENITSQQVEINLDQLSSGTYFLQIRTEAGVRVESFSVQK